MNKTLKLTLTIALAAVFALASFGCSSGTNTAPKVTAAPKADGTTPSPEPKMNFSIGEMALIDETFEAVVTSIEVKQGIGENEFLGYMFKAGEGQKYFVVNMKVKNVGKEARTFLSDYSLLGETTVKLKYGEYTFDAETLYGIDGDFHQEELQPLQTMNGFIAFSIPQEVVDEYESGAVLKMIISGKHVRAVFEFAGGGEN